MRAAKQEEPSKSTSAPAEVSQRTVRSSSSGSMTFSYTSETFPVIATMPDDLRREYGFYDLGLGAGETGMKGVDKAYGVRRVLDRLGRGTERTFAFGDSENDLPMLDAVETAVAMGNAMEVVKQRADYVTDPVADDGVVSGLAHFGLI